MFLLLLTFFKVKLWFYSLIIEKDYIGLKRFLNLLYIAFIIFIFKLNLNDFLKPVIDYRKFNDIIILIRYLLPFISEI